MFLQQFHIFMRIKQCIIKNRCLTRYYFKFTCYVHKINTFMRKTFKLQGVRFQKISVFNLTKNISWISG